MSAWWFAARRPPGLRSVDVARIVELPLLAAMRPQPNLAGMLERGGLRMGHRSPLATAARRVLTVLAQHPSAERRMSVSLIDRVRERLAAESAPLRPNVVAAAIRAESGGVLGDTEVLSNLRMLQTELTGVGILEPLLRAEGTTDVLVTAPDAVWVDDGNGLRRTSIRFADEDAVRRLAQRLALSVGRRLDEAQPWVDGQLTGVTADQFTVRLHAVLAPIACWRYLSVVAGAAAGDPGSRDAHPGRGDRAGGRRTARQDHRRAGWRSWSPVAPAPGRRRCCRPCSVRCRRDERIVCVEDAAELEPRHPHLVKLVARCANIEGVGEITVRDLVRQALRMRPDRIIVGEVRGAEVVDLLAALNTGHDGGAGTVHANNPAEVPARLEALAALGGLDRFALHSQLAAAVQVLLHVGRDRAGKRRLSEIAVLRRDGGGLVGVATAWHADDGFGSGADDLTALLQRARVCGDGRGAGVGVGARGRTAAVSASAGARAGHSPSAAPRRSRPRSSRGGGDAARHGHARRRHSRRDTGTASPTRRSLDALGRSKHPHCRARWTCWSANCGWVHIRWPRSRSRPARSTGPSPEACAPSPHERGWVPTWRPGSAASPCRRGCPGIGSGWRCSGGWRRPTAWRSRR